MTKKESLVANTHAKSYARQKPNQGSAQKATKPALRPDNGKKAGAGVSSSKAINVSKVKTVRSDARGTVARQGSVAQANAKQKNYMGGVSKVALEAAQGVVKQLAKTASDSHALIRSAIPAQSRNSFGVFKTKISASTKTPKKGLSKDTTVAKSTKNSTKTEINLPKNKGPKVTYQARAYKAAAKPTVIGK